MDSARGTAKETVMAKGMAPATDLVLAKDQAREKATGLVTARAMATAQAQATVPGMVPEQAKVLARVQATDPGPERGSARVLVRAKAMVTEKALAKALESLHHRIHHPSRHRAVQEGLAAQEHPCREASHRRAEARNPLLLQNRSRRTRRRRLHNLPGQKH